jgi:hypothetical protein
LETAKKAAIGVKNVFFDYSELSNSVKFLRDYGLAPFVTWASKNIPLQMVSTVTHPERLARVESALSAGQEAVGGKETIIPKEDTREGLIGTGGGRATRVPLPLFDLNKLPIGEYGREDTRNDWLAGMAAPLKMPIELILNQKLYGGRPIDPSGVGKPVKPYDTISHLLGIEEMDPHLAYLMQNIPIQYYDKFVQMMDEESSGKLGKGEALAGLGGLRSKYLSPQEQSKELQRRIQQMILEP